MTVVDPSLDIGGARRDVVSAMRAELPMLAHDIRGALQGVAGGVAALEVSSLPSHLVEQVDRITAASRSLESLIGIAIGDESDRSGELILADLIDSLRQRWAGEARQHGIDLQIIVGGGLPGGLAMEYVPVARILGNLVSNAINHSGRGVVEMTFRRSPEGGLLVRIRDDGPGIPAETVARVLGPDGGTGIDKGASHGLGLAIVRRLTDEAGAGLALRNIDGTGTEASVQFPAALCIEATVHAAAPAAGSDRPDLTGYRILLAEDNPTNQMVASQMLRALGAEFTVCSDGVEALEAFEAGEYDLVVCDIEMPRLSGLDVIRRIRARPDVRAGTPVVALTAYALREHRDRIAEAGANGLISKPITSVDALGRGLSAHIVKRPASVDEGRAPPEGAVELRGAAATAPNASAANEADGPVVDRRTYDALADAIGAEMMAELLGKVIADLADSRDALAGAIADGEIGPIRSSSHILISVAGAIGALRLQECARALNRAAHLSEAGDLTAGVEQCIAEIDAATGFVRNERSSVGEPTG